MRARFSPVAPIAIQPLGAVDAGEIRRAARLIREHFGAPLVIEPPVPLPAAGWSHARRQHDADLLLDELFARLPARCLRVIGVTEQDLYVSGRTFVFGYAHLSDGMALYSLWRLREAHYHRPPDAALEEERVRRALVHELGHTFGAPHCPREECSMRTVTQLETLDSLSTDYCADCRDRVREGLGVAPWSARGRFERGMALYRRGELTRAVEELEHAVRCAPLDPRYRHALDGLTSRALEPVPALVQSG